MEEHDVVVALGNPANAAKLTRLACMMASEFEGKVIAVTVVILDDDAGDDAGGRNRMGQAQDLLEAAEEVATDLGARFDSRLAMCRSIEDVLDEVADAEHAKAIVMGYSERENPMGNEKYDRLIDQVAAHAPCNLVVARFREGGEEYKRVLVPVAQRLNMDVRRDLVAALRNQAGAQVDLVHFARNAAEGAAVTEDLEEWLTEHGASGWIKPQVDVHLNPGEAIVEACKGYDAVVLGTPSLHTLRRQLFGSIPEYVAETAECATLLIRQHEGVKVY